MKRLAVLFREAFALGGQLLSHDETHLSCDAEVGDADKDYLLEHRVFPQLVRGLLQAPFSAVVQLFRVHEGQVHHVADVEVENPVSLPGRLALGQLSLLVEKLVPHTQGVPDVNLELLALAGELERLYLLHGLERENHAGRTVVLRIASIRGRIQILGCSLPEVPTLELLDF